MVPVKGRDMEKLDKIGWWLSGACAAGLFAGSAAGVLVGPTSNRGIFSIEGILGLGFAVLAWCNVRRG